MYNEYLNWDLKASMLITTSFLAYTGGLNRAPDSASRRKLKSTVKSAFTLRAAIAISMHWRGRMSRYARFPIDFQQNDNSLKGKVLAVLSA